MELFAPKVVSFTSTNKPYGWLGNMSKFAVIHDGKVWPSAEHLFQALRFPISSPVREAIRLIPSPMGAKMHAKSLQTGMVVIPRSPVDVALMASVLTMKLQQHPSLGFTRRLRGPPGVESER